MPDGMASGAARFDFSGYRRLTLPRHETLFFEDAESRELYLLLTGSLGVYRNEVQVATIDQPMSLVGEISALTGRPRAATVRALEVSTLAVVDDPEPLFADHPRLGLKLARVLALRLAEMNLRFVELKELMTRFRPAAEPRAGGGAEGEGKGKGEGRGEGKGKQGAEAADARANGGGGDALSADDDSRAPGSSGGRSPGMDEDTLEALTRILDWDPSTGEII